MGALVSREGTSVI